MTRSWLFAVVVLCASLSACGGNDTKEFDCDEGQRYQNREEGKRVVAPGDLDQLNEFGEMPIPNADPDAASAPAGRCVDMPPPIDTSS